MLKTARPLETGEVYIVVNNKEDKRRYINQREWEYLSYHRVFVGTPSTLRHITALLEDGAKIEDIDVYRGKQMMTKQVQVQTVTAKILENE